MKDSGIEWIGKIPEHWQLMKLKRIIKSGTMITYGIVQAGPHIEDGVPYIRTSDMAGNTLPPERYLKTSPEELIFAIRRMSIEKHIDNQIAGHILEGMQDELTQGRKEFQHYLASKVEEEKRRYFYL